MAASLPLFADPAFADLALPAPEPVSCEPAPLHPALWRALEDWLDDEPAVHAARVRNPQRLYWMPTDTNQS